MADSIAKWGAMKLTHITRLPERRWPPCAQRLFSDYSDFSNPAPTTQSTFSLPISSQFNLSGDIIVVTPHLSSPSATPSHSLSASSSMTLETSFPANNHDTREPELDCAVTIRMEFDLESEPF